MEECYKVDIPQHSMPLEAILGRNFMYVSIQIPWSPSRANVFIRWGVHNSASPVEEIRTRPWLTFPALTKVGMERHVQWIITQRSIGTDPGVKINIYQSLSNYIIPGPPVFSCSGSPLQTSNPPVTSNPPITPNPPTTTDLPTGGAAQWAQCGGNGFTGPATCVSPFRCVKLNDWVRRAYG